MKVIRKRNNTPSGSSLCVTLLFGLGDIKSALLSVRKQIGPNESLSMSLLVQMLYETATDRHMPQEPRRYIAEWMARRAVIDGYVFKSNVYMGNADTGEDTYLIDEESIRNKMRGRKPKVEQQKRIV
jgi:hypothetical protein